MRDNRRKFLKTIAGGILLGSAAAAVAAAPMIPKAHASGTSEIVYIDTGDTIDTVISGADDGSVCILAPGDYSDQDVTISQNISLISLRNQFLTDPPDEPDAGFYPLINNLTIDSSDEDLSSVYVQGICITGSLTQNAATNYLRGTLYRDCFINTGVTVQGSILNDFTTFDHCKIANYSGRIAIDFENDSNSTYGGINQFFLMNGSEVIVEPNDYSGDTACCFYLGEGSQVALVMAGGELDIYSPAYSGAIIHCANMYGLEANLAAVRSELEVPITGLFECLDDDNSGDTQYNLSIDFNGVLGGLSGSEEDPGTNNLLNISETSRVPTEISKFRVRGTETAEYAQFMFGNLPDGVGLVTDIDVTSPFNYGLSLEAPSLGGISLDSLTQNPYPFTVVIYQTGQSHTAQLDTTGYETTRVGNPNMIILPSGWYVKYPSGAGASKPSSWEWIRYSGL